MAPPKKGSPIPMILLFLGIAGAAAFITLRCFPTDPPRDPEPERPRVVTKRLIEVPVVPPEIDEPDAAPDAQADASADAELEAAASTKNRVRRPMPTGEIDGRRVSAFMRTKSGAVRRCYERRLKQNNALQGVLEARIRIHPTGRVMNVSFGQDTLYDNQVRTCISSAIRTWQFPQPDGGAVTVSNVFRFTPRI